MGSYIPDSVILPGTAAGAASGATSAALNRGNIWQGALIGAGTGTVQAGWRSYFGSQEVNLGQQDNQLLSSILGKIGNIPNTVLGLAWGGVGMIGGASVSFGNNAIQFTNHPWAGTAITLGNTISYAPLYSPGARYDASMHEFFHTFQGEQLGPLYLPSNIVGGTASLIVNYSSSPTLSHAWHERTNWNEVGPQSTPPRVW